MIKISPAAAPGSAVDERVSADEYGASSEYVREPIPKDQARRLLRALLLEGASSPQTAAVDAAWFNSLRERLPSASAPREIG